MELQISTTFTGPLGKLWGSDKQDLPKVGFAIITVLLNNLYLIAEAMDYLNEDHWLLLE